MGEIISKVLAGAYCIAEPSIAAVIRARLPKEARVRVGDLRMGK